MTPEEFALIHDLTLDEALLIISRRVQPPTPNSRLALAREALLKTQKRVGVQPVVVEGSELTQVYDPDADVGKVEFYEKKGGVESDPPRRVDDWEEPP